MSKKIFVILANKHMTEFEKAQCTRARICIGKTEKEFTAYPQILVLLS